MSDPFAITDEDMAGLEALASAQLRLALRFAERAEAEPDVDAACRLARASERAARGYRQSLLIKSKLRRDRDADRREVARNPHPRSPQDEARRFKRQRDLYEAVERIACEVVEDRDEVEFILGLLCDQIDLMAASDADFADADLAAQVARLSHALDLVDPPRDDHEPNGSPAASDSS